MDLEKTLLTMSPRNLFALLVLPGAVAAVLPEESWLSPLVFLINTVETSLYFGWLWSIARFFRRQREARERDRTDDIVFVTTALFCVVINLLGLIEGAFEMVFVAVFIVGTILMTIRCVLTSSAALKSYELGRKATFEEYTYDFVLLFVFPVGIWLIQGRLNEYARGGKLDAR